MVSPNWVACGAFPHPQSKSGLHWNLQIRGAHEWRSIHSTWIIQSREYIILHCCTDDRNIPINSCVRAVHAKQCSLLAAPVMHCTVPLNVPREKMIDCQIPIRQMSSVFLCLTKSARWWTLIGQWEVAKASDWLIGDHLCDFEIQIFSENLWKRQTSSMITLMRYREALFSYHQFPERAKNLHLYSLARSERCQDQSNLNDLAPSADGAVSFNPRTYFRSTRL